jgi:hypothetical protein
MIEIKIIFFKKAISKCQTSKVKRQTCLPPAGLPANDPPLLSVIELVTKRFK